MGRIQIEISPEENMILSVYKALKGVSSKKEAVKLLILEKKYLIDKLNN